MFFSSHCSCSLLSPIYDSFFSQSWAHLEVIPWWDQRFYQFNFQITFPTHYGSFCIIPAMICEFTSLPIYGLVMSVRALSTGAILCSRAFTLSSKRGSANRTWTPGSSIGENDCTPFDSIGVSSLKLLGMPIVATSTAHNQFVLPGQIDKPEDLFMWTQ